VVFLTVILFRDPLQGVLQAGFVGEVVATDRDAAGSDGNGLEPPCGGDGEV
jgi:hypothetical protein